MSTTLQNVIRRAEMWTTCTTLKSKNRRADMCTTHTTGNDNCAQSIQLCKTQKRAECAKPQQVTWRLWGEAHQSPLQQNHTLTSKLHTTTILTIKQLFDHNCASGSKGFARPQCFRWWWGRLCLPITSIQSSHLLVHLPGDITSSFPPVFLRFFCCCGKRILVGWCAVWGDWAEICGAPVRSTA